MKYVLIHLQACFCDKIGNYEEAVKLCQDLLHLYNTHPKTRSSRLKIQVIYFTLGMCYYRYGSQQTYLDQRTQMYTKAIEYLDISSSANSYNYLTLYYLAKTYAQLYSTEKAASCISRGLEINQNHLASFLLMVLLQTTNQKWKKSNIILKGLMNDISHQNQSIVSVLHGYVKVKLNQENRLKSKQRDLNFNDILWKLLKQALSPLFSSQQLQQYKDL